MSKSIKAVAKIVTAPIKALYDPVGAFKDVFGGVKDIFAGLTGAAKVSSGPGSEPSSQTVRSSKAPARFILGKASTGGVLAWVQEQTGGQTNGEWLHIVYVLSEGEIAGVDEIYVDEQPISTLGTHATYEVLVNPTASNDFLLENCPDWRSEQIGRNLSFVRVSFRYDAEKFPSGIPDVRFVVRGRRDLYDPRDGQLKYTANTALIILWYLRNRCGIPDDEIIFESFASAANISDELVTDPEGNRTARYFAGAVIGADEKRNSVLENLLSACAGTLIRVGGRWSLQVGAYYGPADFVITEDMVIGTVEGTTEVSNSDAINTVRGTFIDPSQAWADTDYPEVSVQDWIDSDGGELAESQSFSYVTDAYLAQRLANITLRRRRSGGTVSMPLNFNGYNCRPGRAVSVNLPSLNILGEFIVTEWAMGAMDACKVTLKPYEQAIFDDAVGQPYNPLGFINLPVGGLAAVTNLVWTPSGESEVIQGVLSWTPPMQTVLSYTVVIRQAGVVLQAIKVGGEASSCNINGLSSGDYVLSVICYGPGTVSGEATISINVDGPPMPESCAVYASVNTITLVPGNLQHNLNGGTYEYFFNTNQSAPISDAQYLGQGLSFTHTGLGFATNYFYYVRAVNAYGRSAFLFVPASTSRDPKQILDVITGEITESELGQDLTSKIEKIELIDGNGPGSVNERIEEAKTALTEQVVEVNNALTEVQSELQGQIDQISDLADSMPYVPTDTYTIGQATLGEDGKLYQASKAVPVNTPPPNAAYWTDIGQAVQVAVGTAARVTAVETKVTEHAGELTAQSKRIDGVQSSLSGKADASTVTSIGTRVTEAEGKLTSQGQAITGVQNSLTTTNGNVTAAQQAAEAASALAGGKGKVIVQSSAPAVADRLAQNLWIDTTSNANTPKRWNGSAWAAVTDKVATDAAAAAASALTQVATKADASTVQSLVNAVTQHGQEITAVGQSITSINAAISQAGGENLLSNPSFDRESGAVAGLADGWSMASYNAIAFSRSLPGSTLDPAGKMQRIDSASLNSASNYVDLEPNIRPAVSAGQVVSQSAYFKATSGFYVRLYIQPKDQSGVTLSTHTSEALYATGDWQRIVFEGRAMPANTVSARILFRVFGASAAAQGGRVEWDRAQFEIGPVTTGWRDNGSVNASDIAANAAATVAVTGRVAQTEAGLTSQSAQLTQLKNIVGAGDFVAGYAWEMLNSNRGWVASTAGATFTPGPLFSTVAGYTLIQGGSFGKLSGTENPFLRIRLRRRNTSRSEAAMYWANEDGGLAEARRFNWQISISTTDWQEIELDLSGHSGWNGKTGINTIRLDMMNSGDVNGQIDIAYIAVGRRSVAASAQALDNLSSSVSQQGDKLDSVTTRTTSLEGTVNSATSGLPSKASTAALNTLSGRVGATEQGLTANSSSIVDIKSSITGMQGALGATGLDSAPGALWQFDEGAEGWGVANATLATKAGSVTVTATTSDPVFSRGALSIPGGLYSIVRAKVTRRAGAAASDWDGICFYGTSGHGFTPSFYKRIANPNLAIGESAILEWDMGALSAGGTDWTSSTITTIRLDLGAAVGSSFEIDWVAVGRVAPAASSRGLSSLETTVSQVGTALTAETKRIDGLHTSVGSNAAAVQDEIKARSDADSALSTRITTAQAAAGAASTAVQTEATARASADSALGKRVDGVQANLGSTNASVQQISTALTSLNGSASATNVVKVQITANGLRYAAGYGVGIDNAGGVVQSTFAVAADRFAVLNPTADGFVSPFAIQNGQVFINDALISKLAVQNAMVGAGIESAARAANGGPVMATDYNAGQITIQNRTTNGNYMIIRDNGLYMVSGGVVVVELSM